MFPRHIAPAIVLFALLFGSWHSAMVAQPSRLFAQRRVVTALSTGGELSYMPVVTNEGSAVARPIRTPRPTRTPTAIPMAQPTATRTATVVPTAQPTATRTPTAVPTAQPTATRTSTAIPTAQPTATRTPTATLAPTATATWTATPTASAGTHWWGLLGNDGTRLSEEYAAGVRYKLVTVRWKSWMPSEGSVDTGYVNSKLAELNALRNAGFQIILSTGIHDAPGWVHTNYPNSYYVNQYGDVYTEGISAGDANFVFNPAMRALAEAYLDDLFARLGTGFAAVRVGGGRYGELTYPPAVWNGRSNNYWSFDVNAQAQSPVPGWKPGSPSPAGEAQRFLDWHLQKLVELQNWNFSAVRRSYPGPIMILYPSWGIRPGDIDKAITTNLNGSSSAERNGEIQRGFDFARQVASLTDAQAIVTTTWLDADGSQDGGSDQRYWSPVHYLASLAQAHPLHLALYGENTGHGSAVQMDFTAAQMARYGLLGLAWYNETEILSGSYATLADFRSMVDRYGP